MMVSLASQPFLVKSTFLLWRIAVKRGAEFLGVVQCRILRSILWMKYELCLFVMWFPSLFSTLIELKLSLELNFEWWSTATHAFFTKSSSDIGIWNDQSDINNRVETEVETCYLFNFEQLWKLQRISKNYKWFNVLWKLLDHNKHLLQKAFESDARRNMYDITQETVHGTDFFKSAITLR